jgi:DNA-binding MarR family transcriptional regulator
VDIDEELSGLRELDAAVLAGLHLKPELTRRPGHKLRQLLLLRLYGIRGSLTRLERQGYVEPGWSVDHMGAHGQVTEKGRRVAAAAAAILMAKGAERGGLPMAYVRMRLGRRLRR